MDKATFRKHEKLTGETVIRELFASKSSFYSYPFKVIFRRADDVRKGSSSHRILISVPRRLFRKATDRNRIKRLVRECYRLNKYRLAGQPQWVIAYIYTAKDILTFAQMQERFVRTLNRIGHVEKK